jgi:TetR/AcrR family transcriptional regulator, mexCD-oprJ operon repressor
MPEPVPEPTPVRSRQAFQERVSEMILAAAARTLARQEAATLADVAVTAGVARATVYRYFPNRGRLVEAVARRAAESAHEKLIAARVDEVPVEEGLTRAVRAFVDEGEAFVVLARERGRLEAKEFDRLVGSPLRRLLEGGRSSKRIRTDVATDVLVESLLGMVAGVLANCSLGRDDAVASLGAAFLDGALAPEGTES